MEISIANQNFSSDDPLWVLLAEFSLSEFLSDDHQRDGLMARYLFQAVQELGMSPEGMDNIVKALAGFAKETLVRNKQGRLESSGRIRIFCQKKIMDNATSAKPYLTEPDKEQKHISPDSRANTMGGWGYFIIERGEELPPDAFVISHNCIDLYLYKEGQ